jgi:hypothetical protein
VARQSDVEANALKQRRPGAVRSFSMKEADDISGSKRGKRRPSKTDNADAQQKPWLFKPGQSGNPAGRPKGSRNKLAEDFLSDAYQQWQQHGPKALETMATSEPAKFCQMVAGLLPKEMHIKDSALEDMSTDEIRDALARIATIRTFIGSYAAADGDGISPPGERKPH